MDGENEDTDPDTKLDSIKNNTIPLLLGAASYLSFIDVFINFEVASKLQSLKGVCHSIPFSKLGCRTK